MKLFPYQVTGKEFLKQNRACLLADEQGLGKTIQVIEARNDLVQAGDKTLIVCPAAVKDGWRVNLEKYAKHNNTQVINCGEDKPDLSKDCVILNYEYLHRKDFKDALIEFDAAFIVVDEAHYLAHTKSERTKAILRAREGILKRKTFKHVWLLTGTPMTNRPIDMYPLLRAFAAQCLGEYVNYRRFALKFCGARHNDYSANAVKGATNLDLLAKLIRPFYLRREKKDVLPDLPEKFVSVKYFDASEHIQKMETDIGTYHAYLREGKDLGQTSTLRKEIALEKVRIVTNYVTNVDSPAVLFYHHKEVGDYLQGLFPKAIRIDGRDDSKVKAKKLNDFKKKPGLLLAQINSVGTGVDGIQHVCNRAYFVEIPWAPGALGQAIDRLHRIGQQYTVYIEILVLYKCFDEKVYRANQRKQKHIDQVILTTKEKETTMSSTKHTIEENLERLANAVELLVAANYSQAAVQTSAPAQLPPAEDAAPAAPAKKKAAAKPKAEAPKVDREALRQDVVELAKTFSEEYQTLGKGSKADAKGIITADFLNGKATSNCTNEELADAKAALTQGIEDLKNGAASDDLDDEDDI